MKIHLMESKEIYKMLRDKFLFVYILYPKENTKKKISLFENMIKIDKIVQKEEVILFNKVNRIFEHLIRDLYSDEEKMQQFQNGEPLKTCSMDEYKKNEEVKRQKKIKQANKNYDYYRC